MTFWGWRRRQRVATAARNAAKNGTPISVSTIARQAGGDRSFRYRHRDLLELVHAAELEPAAQDPTAAFAGEQGLAAGRPRQPPGAQRPPGRPRPPTGKAAAAGDGAQAAWQESELRAPTDIDELQRRTTRLEQQNKNQLTGEPGEARPDLEAARAANRDPTRAVNDHG
ncbi:hypothetical protein [Streptomyces sp. WZ-12]|uniref:hypothetical protein n=1 Tax=Streptomyces sp. WZ-12 TaxID=3030210 RepID=UPI00238186BF|nr:hypothetical protein [Streptomyces sp. WZ-12]